MRSKRYNVPKNRREDMGIIMKTHENTFLEGVGAS